MLCKDLIMSNQLMGKITKSTVFLLMSIFTFSPDTKKEIFEMKNEKLWGGLGLKKMQLLILYSGLIVRGKTMTFHQMTNTFILS